ncbi:hypothetical protein [Tropicibacter sp. S64]|uniref:hypothetical protein n=1 Tax=Tropicibacter sp. S64 TaxID=3415122 RepID=UPI003C7E9CCF
MEALWDKFVMAALAEPSREQGIDAGTVVQWREWTTVADLKSGRKEPLSAVLTDNGIQFAEQPRNRNASQSRKMRFDRIEHCLTRPNHPWTNGQVKRMNRTIKEGEARSRSGASATAERQTRSPRQPDPIRQMRELNTQEWSLPIPDPRSSRANTVMSMPP